MIFAFTRFGAVRGEDYCPKGKRRWVRLHENGGKRHDMPAHHNLEAYLDEYIREDNEATRSRSAIGRVDA